MLLVAWSMTASSSRAEASSVLDGCPEYVIEMFSESPARACGIASCETGGTFRNDLIGRAGEVSMWQIHPIHFYRYDRQRLIDDPEYATEVAFEMSSGGRNWRAWSCS